MPGLILKLGYINRAVITYKIVKIIRPSRNLLGSISISIVNVHVIRTTQSIGPGICGVVDWNAPQKGWHVS